MCGHICMCKKDHAHVVSMVNTYPFHRINHFSADGTQLLRERAKAIRPYMYLDIDEPDTSGLERY